jgi:hypothetical protein
MFGMQAAKLSHPVVRSLQPMVYLSQIQLDVYQVNHDYAQHDTDEAQRQQDPVTHHILPKSILTSQTVSMNRIPVFGNEEPYHFLHTA